MLNLEGRNAVITGAAKGIGAATVERFLRDGVANVALLDVDYEGAIKTAQSLDPSGARTIAIKCDVVSEEAVDKAFFAIYSRLGKVDILVNNAGFVRDKMFHRMPLEQFRQVLAVHLYGAVHCTGQVIGSMREQGYGRIVNLASTAIFGNVGQTNYSAAKAGLVGFTRTLAKEAGAKGITVNCVAPGYINTDIIMDVPPEKLAAALSAHPMHRFGEPSEVAAVIAFLASSDASYVSGQCIVCSGGV